jgi:hypothetical protein
LAEDAALHIVSLMVECLHLSPGLDAKQIEIKEIFDSQGWESSNYKPGERSALRRGWIKIRSGRVELTAAGFVAATGRGA